MQSHISQHKLIKHQTGSMKICCYTEHTHCEQRLFQQAGCSWIKNLKNPLHSASDWNLSPGPANAECPTLRFFPRSLHPPPSALWVSASHRVFSQWKTAIRSGAWPVNNISFVCLEKLLGSFHFMCLAIIQLKYEFVPEHVSRQRETAGSVDRQGLVSGFILEECAAQCVCSIFTLELLTPRARSFPK